jgi:carbon storage regulator
MLILSRKRGQSIIIHNDIEIIVTAIEGDQVKIGIVAPKELSIMRKEVLEDVKAANRQSISTKTDFDELKSWSIRTKDIEKK